MAFKTLTIDSPTELHVKTGQLLAIQENGEVQIALSDLSCIVLSHPGIKISSAALAKLGENGISVLTLGKSYLPATITLPFASNSRYSAIVDKQLGISESLRGKLWKKLVKQKIANHAAVLDQLCIDNSVLLEIAKEVRVADSTNREALAARIYFQLYNPGFVREDVCAINSALNYGYAVVRSIIARHVVSHGLITSVGLHHSNEHNEFNLVDDLIEPFRAFVDSVVVELNLEGEDPLNLSKDTRKEITTVLRAPCIIDGHLTSIMTATEQCVISLNRAIEQGDASELQLPSMAKVE